MSLGESLFCFFVNALETLGKTILEHLENGFCDCEIQFVSRKSLFWERKENGQPRHLQRRKMMGFLLAFKLSMGEQKQLNNPSFQCTS